jgi:hypothetical protein
MVARHCYRSFADGFQTNRTRFDGARRLLFASVQGASGGAFDLEVIVIICLCFDSIGSSKAVSIHTPSNVPLLPISVACRNQKPDDVEKRVLATAGLLTRKAFRHPVPHIGK